MATVSPSSYDQLSTRFEAIPAIGQNSFLCVGAQGARASDGTAGWWLE